MCAHVHMCVFVYLGVRVGSLVVDTEVTDSHQSQDLHSQGR